MDMVVRELALTDLLADCFSNSDIRRGQTLYDSGGVDIKSIGRKGVIGSVRGNDSPSYRVGVDFVDIVDGVLGVYCQCGRFESNHYSCKHVWALLEACGEHPISIPEEGEEDIELYPVYITEIEIGGSLTPSENSRPSIKPKAAVKPKKKVKRAAKQKPIPRWQEQLSMIPGGGTTHTVAELPLFHRQVVSTYQMWFAISLADFAQHKRLEIHLYRSTKKMDKTFGKPQRFSYHNRELQTITDEVERNALTMLEQEAPSQSHYYSYHSSSNRFRLKQALVRTTLAAMAATGRLAWTMDASQYLNDAQPLTFDDGPEWSLRVSVSPSVSDGGVQRIRIVPTLCRGDELLPIDEVVGISAEGVFLTANGISILKSTHGELAKAFQKSGVIELPQRNLPALMAQAITWQFIDLDLHPDLPITIIEESPKPKLHLSSPQNDARSLNADVLMKYGERELNAVSTEKLIWDDSTKSVLRRDFAAEQIWMDQLPATTFSGSNYAGQISLSRESLPSLVMHLSKLEWEVVADGNVLRRASGFHIDVESGVDWFDLHAKADFDGQSVSLPELLKAQRKGLGFVVLDDGSHGMLPEAWLAKFGNLEKTGSIEDDSIRFTRTQALLLDAMLAEQENVSLDKNFKLWCEKLNSFTGIAPSAAPAGLSGNLRDYQALGLGWLNFLNEFRLGGCLADDMGLGKTIQVLSLLEQRRTRTLNDTEKRLPSLIVVPKSLVFNWMEEATKFTPELKCLNYTGTERRDYYENFDHYDAVITTYGTLRNDAAKLREKTFDYVILDEAQAIKNPSSQAAKASRLMHAEHRLAMTGTPVENHLGDLWSLFDFLNPGMLGSGLGSVGTSASIDDQDRLDTIAKSLRPFILRRTKQQVLTELPEKTEQTLHCDMEPKQRKLYNELRDHYRASISGKVKELGLAKSKMHVLEALLRLRQAACDPRLIDPKSKVKGAKLPMLMEQLEELTAEGHKALVFSQFTSLLALLRRDVDAKGWNYEYLDGKTRKRNEPVQRFQEDPNCNLFLISLKAGGHGLNLTAADYVFILDPWWNPAVEAQAIDRAHRMGQTKSVNAYRMICRDTVEEKIVDLQTSKRKLADAIISQKQSLISELTSDDLRMLFE